jgi:hypothetical protein
MRTIQKTTLEYWALIAEIAGAIAVVMSVIYLGVQIRAQYEDPPQSGTLQCVVARTAAIRMMIAEPKLSRLSWRVLSSPDTLSEGQWFRCATIY